MGPPWIDQSWDEVGRSVLIDDIAAAAKKKGQHLRSAPGCQARSLSKRAYYWIPETITASDSLLWL